MLARLDWDGSPQIWTTEDTERSTQFGNVLEEYPAGTY